jgi:hypothetical protein
MFALSRLTRSLVLLTVVLVLSACGGGSSSTDATFTVTAVPGDGGSIFPGSQMVGRGATATFTVSPDTGYSIATVSGCNGSLDGDTYTTGAIIQGLYGGGQLLFEWLRLRGRYHRARCSEQG